MTSRGGKPRAVSKESRVSYAEISYKVIYP